MFFSYEYDKIVSIIFLRSKKMKNTFGKRNMSALILFGLIGQIAWSVENMYFNLFVFDTIEPNLSAITLMVQLSAIAATAVTLIAGTLSDKLGNRRLFISIGYIVWGVTVGIFGFISPSLFESLFGIEGAAAIKAALTAVIIGDCVMTLFGSTANDAAFNAWVTEVTPQSLRGRIESILSILPLLSLLIVAGGFGILVGAVGYAPVFLSLGAVISLSGILGIFIIRDSETIEKSGALRDIVFGFKVSTVKSFKPFYVTLLIMCVYGIACQIFMPYMIIYMKEYLGFGVLEYSVIFGLAIAFGAIINLFLGKLADTLPKEKMLYTAAAVFAAGLLLMYLMKDMGKWATLILFGISGFIMITGYIFISSLTGAILREQTPQNEAGKLQGVRMIFSVLIPMLVGPTLGNGINKLRNIPLPNADTSADAMTTLYIPAPEIYLAAAAVTLILFAIIPLLIKVLKNKSKE